eukprot:830309-Prymnesium_polylepis.1
MSTAAIGIEPIRAARRAIAARVRLQLAHARRARESRLRRAMGRGRAGAMPRPAPRPPRCPKGHFWCRRQRALWRRGVPAHRSKRPIDGS